MGLIRVPNRDKPAVAVTVLANMLAIVLAEPADDLVETVNGMLAERGAVLTIRCSGRPSIDLDAAGRDCISSR
jgi:hypothetical protein